MRRYVQTPGPIGEFSELALRQRAEPLDLVYVGYGLLVVAVVVASYMLGAFGWLPDDPRSEEHTSELQSRLHLVCRLLLEKKKKKTHQIVHIRHEHLSHRRE